MASGNGRNGNGKGVKQIVREMIGRWASPVIVKLQPFLTVDWTRADYAFWGRLRRGKEKTYELGGLFAKPIAEIMASFALGKGVTVTVVETPSPPAPLPQGEGRIPPSEEKDQRKGAEGQEAQRRTGDDEATNQALAGFVQEELSTLIAWYEDSLGHGDSYLVVNPDGSLTRATPDAVEIITEPEGSQHVVGYRVTARLPTVTIVDEFREASRTRTVKTALTPGPSPSGRGGITAGEQTWENLTGKIAVIHLPNDPEANEIYGHPIYEGLLRLFAEYDDTLVKSLRGVKIMGNPIPVAEGLEDAEASMRANATGTESYVDAQGNTQEKYTFDFGQIEMFWLGKGGKFEFKSPGAFAENATAMLKKLFYVMLEHIRIPEWVWGGAVASSKASVDAQTPAFELNIDGRRLKLEKALRQLFDVWLATISLWTPGIRTDAKLAFDWPAILPEDKAVKLEYIKAANEAGVVTEETYLRLLALVDDPAAEVEAARAESKAKAEAFRDNTDRAIEEELKALTPGPSPNGRGETAPNGKVKEGELEAA